MLVFTTPDEFAAAKFHVTWHPSSKCIEPVRSDDVFHVLIIDSGPATKNNVGFSEAVVERVLDRGYDRVISHVHAEHDGYTQADSKNRENRAFFTFLQVAVPDLDGFKHA
jgi:hypothetical protein